MAGEVPAELAELVRVSRENAVVVEVSTEGAPLAASEMTSQEVVQLSRLADALRPPQHGSVNQAGVDLGAAPSVGEGAHATFVAACQRRTV